MNNFLNLVEKEFYSGLIFHRVIPNFMIQAGGYEVGVKYRTHDDNMVPNESFNGLKNKRFSVAAARTDDPDSADTQFYINVVDNPFLDAQPNKPGYTVFGRVIDGFDAVERIELTDTHLRMGMAGVPEQPIVISAIKLVNPSKGPSCTQLRANLRKEWLVERRHAVILTSRHLPNSSEATLGRIHVNSRFF